VDNTDAPADAAEYNRMIEYGDYSDIRTVTVP